MNPTDDRVIFIAEAGVNHNGSVEMALQLVVAAKQAGADCIKFQTFRADEVASASAPKAAYQLETTDRRESQLEMLRKLELPDEAWPKIANACREAGLVFLSTPYGPRDVALLEQVGVIAYKVASGQLVETIFLARVARTGKPILLSTGMATLAEVAEAVQCIRETRKTATAHPPAGFASLTLLQCTTDYPSRLEDANLGAIPLMANAFGVPVGYSDHTEDAMAAVVAASLGARIFEKHFTLDRRLPGPDQSSSVEPHEFAAYASTVRRAIQALGKGLKEPCERERLNLRNMRRGCVAARDLPAGSVIADQDILFRRPLWGVRAADAELLVGRTVIENIPSGAYFDLRALVAGNGENS